MVEKLKAAGNTRQKKITCDASMLHALHLVKSCNNGCIIYPLASRAKSSACLLPTATGGQFSPCFIRIFWLLAFGKNGCVQLCDVFFLNSTPGAPHRQNLCSILLPYRHFLCAGLQAKGAGHLPSPCTDRRSSTRQPMDQLPSYFNI